MNLWNSCGLGAVRKKSMYGGYTLRRQPGDYESSSVQLWRNGNYWMATIAERAHPGRPDRKESIYPGIAEAILSALNRDYSNRFLFGGYTLRRVRDHFELWKSDGWMATITGRTLPFRPDLTENMWPGIAEVILSALNGDRNDEVSVDLLRRSNVELVDALMGMVNKFFSSDGKGLLYGGSMPEKRGAIGVLIDAGFAKEVNGGYELLWEKLSERWMDINGEPLPARPLMIDVCEVDVAHWNGKGAE
ncbi:MAG: hypothetical protein ACYCQL_00640 [Acidithiobacillus sp.]